MDNGTKINRSIADQVASGMKAWALNLGATHYTHWFQPLTGTTAEKHDSFFEPTGNGEPLRSSQEVCWFNKSRMHLLSRTVVFATLSKLVDIQPGILHHRPSSLVRHFVFQQYSFHTLVKHWITKRHYFAHYNL